MQYSRSRFIIVMQEWPNLYAFREKWKLFINKLNLLKTSKKDVTSSKEWRKMAVENKNYILILILGAHKVWIFSVLYRKTQTGLTSIGKKKEN